ncbi:uncharacterized protein BDV14DRAFT_199715 [Aspergillus stella-maris]|uniref:uncharacterized protein n=1 Tax=Aspergillus stella-maris TaxID=1810926 RepID=UPI003CCD5994
MIRRNSFCSSELPSASRALDHFFEIARPHPSLDPVDPLTSWTPPRTRAHSVGMIASEPEFDPDFDDLVEELIIPQVDGPSAKRKVRKLEKMRKKQQARSESFETDDEYKETPEREKKHTYEYEEGRSSKKTVFGSHGVNGVTPFHTERTADVWQETEQGQTEQNTQKDKTEDNASCQIHNRPLCQYKSICCVHKAPADCPCPPSRSCCCTHHAGDCCNCQPDSQTDDDSKTLLLGTRSATPPIKTSTAAAPATVSTTASASSPSRPSGVKLMVTPASPSPFNAKPIIMGGVEDARALALHSSEEFSNSMVGKMESNDMCDIQLTLLFRIEQAYPIYIRAHKCIVSRSGLVAKLLESPYYSQEIRAVAGENFILFAPWEQVVHYLYGRPALTAQILKPMTLNALGYDPYPQPGDEPDYPFSLQSAMLDMALGYGVCAAFFYLQPQVNIAFTLALDLLSWETVEHVLHFGLRTETFAVTLPNTQRDPSPKGGASADDGPPARSIHPYPIPDLQRDWSRRLVASAIHFIADHIQPNFKLYCAAQSGTVPDRVPDFLKNVAPSSSIAQATDTAEEEPTAKEQPATGEQPTAEAVHVAVPSPPTPSAAVANNPRLADVKFGSFPARSEEWAKYTKATTTTGSSSQTPPCPQHEAQTQALIPATPTPQSKNSKPSLGPLVATGTSLSPAPGPEITIPSAVLLTLPFYELRLAFDMLSKRGVLSETLAKAIVLERETRRRAALRNYAQVMLKDIVKQKTKEEKEMKEAAEKAASTGSTSGRKKGKARKAAREEKKRAEEEEKKKEKEGNKETSEAKPEPAPAPTPAPAPAASNVEVVMPEAVRELCYQEFLTSKVYGDPQQSHGHGHGQLETENVLEREWVGFHY